MSNITDPKARPISLLSSDLSKVMVLSPLRSILASPFSLPCGSNSVKNSVGVAYVKISHITPLNDDSWAPINFTSSANGQLTIHHTIHTTYCHHWYVAGDLLSTHWRYLVAVQTWAFVLPVDRDEGEVLEHEVFGVPGTPRLPSSFLSMFWLFSLVSRNFSYRSVTICNGAKFKSSK